MKKKLLASLTLSALLLTIGGISANAATTDGEATFKASLTPWKVIKPNEVDTVPDELITPLAPVTPSASNGIQLMHAPAIKFGDIDISPVKATYDALYESYEEVAGSGNAFQIPQFLQIGGASGDIAKTWNVTVIQDTFFKNAAGHKLENTEIIMNDVVTTNNTKAPAGVVKGIDLTTAIAIPVAEVPTSGGAAGTAVKVFETDPAATPATVANSTNGTISSLVFADAGTYAATDYGSTGAAAPLATDTHSAIQLVVPAGESPSASKYTTTFTWTLTATP